MRRLVMAAVAVCLATAAGASGPVVRTITFDTDINGATAHRIVDAIDAADAAGDALVLLVLDTPGGSVSATEDVVKRMLAAKTPIAAWVGPSGARVPTDTEEAVPDRPPRCADRPASASRRGADHPCHPCHPRFIPPSRAADRDHGWHG